MKLVAREQLALQTLEMYSLRLCRGCFLDVLPPHNWGIPPLQISNCVSIWERLLGECVYLPNVAAQLSIPYMLEGYGIGLG